MTDNKTNPTRSNYDLASMMLAAHAAARETVRPGDNYAATLTLALRQAWTAAKTPSARAQWASMTGDEQADALRRMAGHRRERCAAETDKRGEHRADPYGWTYSEPDALQQITSEAWIVMDRMLDAAERQESETGERVPLAWILARAADHAARVIKRREHRRPRADRDDPDTGEAYIIDAPRPDPIAPGPESAACTIDALERSCADTTDRYIMRMLAYGVEQREIADRLTITPAAVCQRRAKMRDRYHSDDQ